MYIAIEKWGLKAIVDTDVRRCFAGRKPPIFLDPGTAQKVRSFHQSLPNYKPTPLVNLSNLSRELGVGNIYVKDESARLGLNAFKVLGSSYALGKFMGQKLGVEEGKLTFDYLCSPEMREKIGPVTFATATDGNHGRGVAWMAQQLGQPAVVYLPRGVARHRVEAIEETGAQAVVTDVNYDDTVRLIVKVAKEKGWHLIQDTAWEGYEDIPRWIMQGYTTMAAEIDDQLASSGLARPTHVFLQAGVGSFASTILGYFVNRDGEKYPRTIIMEPEKAACIFASARAGKGEPQRVTGDLATIMAGLSCGEPSPLAWDIIHSFADGYVVCPDYVAAQGIRILAHPLGDDRRLVAGESGSVGLGLLSLLYQKEECAPLKDKFSLDEHSSVLLINTEGDTDPVNYRRILWDGRYPLP